MSSYLLVVSGFQGGGAEKVCVKLANLLYENNKRVEILVLKNEHGVLRSSLKPEIKVHTLNKSRARDSGFAIFKFINNNRYKYILNFNFELAVLISLCVKLLRINSLVYLRVINTLSKDNSNSRLIRIKGYFYNLFDMLIFQCDAMKDDFKKLISLSNDSSTIYNPCLNENIVSNDCKKAVNNSVRKVVFAGRLEDQKDLSFMIRSFFILSGMDSNVELNIFGEGSLLHDLKSLVDNLGLSDNVFFYKYTTDLNDVFLDADVCLLTSKYEGFPNFLLDSISFGVPCVSLDCQSGPSEIINTTCGILVENRIESDFALAVKSSLDKKWDHELIKLSAQKRFGEKEFVNKYISVFEN